jgi:hypothetical protein
MLPVLAVASLLPHLSSSSTSTLSAAASAAPFPPISPPPQPPVTASEAGSIATKLASVIEHHLISAHSTKIVNEACRHHFGDRAVRLLPAGLDHQKLQPCIGRSEFPADERKLVQGSRLEPGPHREQLVLEAHALQNYLVDSLAGLLTAGDIIGKTVQRGAEVRRPQRQRRNTAHNGRVLLAWSSGVGVGGGGVGGGGGRHVVVVVVVGLSKVSVSGQLGVRKR